MAQYYSVVYCLHESSVMQCFNVALRLKFVMKHIILAGMFDSMVRNFKGAYSPYSRYISKKLCNMQFEILHHVSCLERYFATSILLSNCNHYHYKVSDLLFSSSHWSTADFHNHSAHSKKHNIFLVSSCSHSAQWGDHWLLSLLCS